MNRLRAATAVLLSVAFGGLTQAADPGSAVAPTSAPGWTGVTRPKAVITARQEIMEKVILSDPAAEKRV